MPRETAMPPPSRQNRGGEGGMTQEDPSIYGKLSQLAGINEGEGEGDIMGGGADQSAELIKSGTDQLMQAAQMNPALQPFITKAMSILQQGVEQLAGGGAPAGEMGEETGGEVSGQGSGGRNPNTPRRETSHKVREW